MFVVIDDRESVTRGYAAGFDREGVVSIGFSSKEFRDWLECAVGNDVMAIGAFLLGDCSDRTSIPKSIRNRSRAPIIALNNLKQLQHTIELFEAGVDDVVHVPIHVREILVRTAVIRRRTSGQSGVAATSLIRVFLDGRDPEIGGRTLALPLRIAHSRASGQPSGKMVDQDSALQCHLRPLRLEFRRKRDRESRQQATQETAQPSRLRSDRFEAVYGIPAR
jgi:DNA-binding response OmpR family regulator